MFTYCSNLLTLKAQYNQASTSSISPLRYKVTNKIFYDILLLIAILNESFFYQRTISVWRQICNVFSLSLSLIMPKNDQAYFENHEVYNFLNIFGTCSTLWMKGLILYLNNFRENISRIFLVLNIFITKYLHHISTTK